MSGFWQRLKGGLTRSASKLGEGIANIGRKKLDATTLESLEDLLIESDLGLEASANIVEALRRTRHDAELSADEIKSLLAAEVAKMLAPVANPLDIDATKRPFVLLVVGVNGSGKTTTIGKLAATLTREGKKVVLAAADTFRAAAIEQLQKWGERTNTTVVAHKQGADPAGVAFEAIERARTENADILLIDTAGRLQNKTALMDELEKILRVIRKLDPGAPHASLLVLDATVGQNALSQAEAFTKTAGITGLVMTKLDGTAKGGILVALAAKFALPIHFIGVGEGVDDLSPFEPDEFARALVGLDQVT
ncbi:MAG TPA: signal recognition particle-docking protein FtsY [Xanthobacteraceae bacterium]|nr:signal recognition particle-docking protein FtsY [Xanthobacteraceae bacterium]